MPRSPTLPTVAMIMTAMAVLSSLAEAQTNPATAPKGGCEVAAPAQSPTTTEKGPHSGTKNSGSTGWSGGGMGGSQNDTTQSGPLPGSQSEQPKTAQGLDPTKPKPGEPPC